MHRTVLVMFVLAGGGAGSSSAWANETALSLRRDGMLVKAANAHESRRDFESQLHAAEAFLRAGGGKQALRCFRAAENDRPGRKVVLAWIDWLTGHPRPLVFDPVEASAAAELHLAGLLARLAGSKRDEQMLLLAAYRKEPKHPVYGADLLRTVGESEQITSKLARSVERTIALAQAAAQEPGSRASKLLASLAGSAGADPRISALVNRDDSKPNIPRDVMRFVADCKGVAIVAVLGHSAETVKRAGSVAALREPIQRWTDESERLTEKYLGTANAWRIAVARARVYFQLCDLKGTETLHEFVRDGLAELVPVFLAGADTREGREALRPLSDLFLRVEPEYSHEALSAALLRRSSNANSAFVLRWHMARNLRRNGKASHAKKILEELQAQHAALDVQFIDAASLRRELLYASLQSARFKLTQKPVRLGDDSQALLRAEKGKVLILQFFRVSCGWCETGAELIQKWQDMHRDVGVSVISISTDHDPDGRREWAESTRWRVVSDEEVETLLGDSLGVWGTPTYCVVNDQGEVAMMVSGTNDLRFLLRMIRLGRIASLRQAKGDE